MRFYRFLTFLGFTGLGALIAWLLFDFKPPGGIIIMTGSAIGCVVSLAMNPNAREIKIPSIFEMRSEDRWPLVRKLSAIAFVVFFCLAPIFQSPRLIANEDMRRSLFLFCMGLGLLGGTPIMFALKSNLRLLGYGTFFMSLMLVGISLLGILQVRTPPFIKMLGLTLGMVVSLIVILFYLRRKA